MYDRLEKMVERSSGKRSSQSLAVISSHLAS